MNDNEKLYVKVVQKEMNEALESGQLNAEQQYNYINTVCQKLILVDDIPIKFKDYYDELDKIEDNFKKEYKEYVEKRGELAKDIYEEIKKL
jgi:hypothetical protein